MVQTLGEELLRRSETKKEIENIQSRIHANLWVRENGSPLEDPKELIKEALRMSDTLFWQTKMINAVNNRTMLLTNMSLSEAIVEREMMIRNRNILNKVVDAAQKREQTEVKMVIAVSMEEIRSDINLLSMKIKALETEIQKLNWKTEI
ncbi:MAG: DIP1984 family protein [Candidatus Methanoplasma sp.]|jgi:hypothetical protein|nr:DIP1984 family protein [Candidatus Methanoplasma sp.]